MALSRAVLLSSWSNPGKTLPSLSDALLTSSCVASISAPSLGTNWDTRVWIAEREGLIACLLLWLRLLLLFRLPGIDLGVPLLVAILVVAKALLNIDSQPFAVLLTQVFQKGFHLNADTGLHKIGASRSGPVYIKAGGENFVILLWHFFSLVK